MTFEVIGCNKGSCCEHLAGDVNIYSYGSASLLAAECVVCVWVFVFIKSEQQ